MQALTNEIRLTARLIDSLYVEAMVLADEVRAYFDEHGRTERDALPPLQRISFSCESLKVTTRLMHVIAWLLTQRAVAAGELNRVEAGSADRRLGPAADTDEVLAQRLPASALDLIRASEELYGRVRRLDQGHFAEDREGSPARSLQSRLQRSF